jgi:cytochrome b6-f complex iron-sulfur subunit
LKGAIVAKRFMAASSEWSSLGKGSTLGEQEVTTRKDFIRLGSAVGVSLAGFSASVACSDTASEGWAIAQVSEVPLGSAIEFRDDYSGDRAVLVHLEGGQFVAYSVVCTHQGCVVLYKDGELVCPCHGSVFDPARGGSAVRGPAREPLQKVEVDTEDGKVVRVRRPWWRRVFDG